MKFSSKQQKKYKIQPHLNLKDLWFIRNKIIHWRMIIEIQTKGYITQQQYHGQRTAILGAIWTEAFKTTPKVSAVSQCVAQHSMRLTCYDKKWKKKDKQKKNTRNHKPLRVKLSQNRYERSENCDRFQFNVLNICSQN